MAEGDPDLHPSPLEDSSPLSYATAEGSAAASPAATPQHGPPPLSDARTLVAERGDDHDSAIVADDEDDENDTAQAYAMAPRPAPPPPNSFFHQSTSLPPPGMESTYGPIQPHHLLHQPNDYSNTLPSPVSLTTINMEKKKPSFVEQHLKNVRALRSQGKILPSLKILNLSSVLSSSAETWTCVLEIVSGAPNLESLCLSSNSLGGRMKSLVDAIYFGLKEYQEDLRDEVSAEDLISKLQVVELDWCELDEESAQVLSHFISNSCPNLKRFYAETNKFGSYGVEMICSALHKCKLLIEVDLSGNCEFDSFETAATSIRSLMDSNDSLERLYCKSNFVGEFGCKIIGEGLMDRMRRGGFGDECIFSIDVQDNPIDPMGARFLMEVPQVFVCHVSDIDLSYCPLQDEGVEILVRGFLVNGNCFDLRRFLVAGVGMTDRGLSFVCNLLPYSEISELSVSDNWEVSLSGIEELIQAVEQAPWVEDIQVLNLPVLPHHHSTFRNLVNRNLVWLDYFGYLVLCGAVHRQKWADRGLVGEILNYVPQYKRLHSRLKSKPNAASISRSHIEESGLVLDLMTSLTSRVQDNAFHGFSQDVRGDVEMQSDSNVSQIEKEEVERNSNKRPCIRVDSS